MINVELSSDEFEVLTDVFYLFKKKKLHYSLPLDKLAHLSNFLHKLDESYERRSSDE